MQLPHQSFPKNSDTIAYCCGEKTHIRAWTVDVRMITNPPATTAREILITHWQCHVVEDHFGDIWEGKHEPLVEHQNVFETTIDEGELGNEGSYRN